MHNILLKIILYLFFLIGFFFYRACQRAANAYPFSSMRMCVPIMSLLLQLLFNQQYTNIF